MHESIQLPSGIKNEKIVHLYPHRYILSILLYMFIVFLGGYKPTTLKLLKISN